jgi:CRISPR-associated protein Cas6
MRAVDVRFPVEGDKIPVDHGYQVFSAVSRIVPNLHGDSTVAVHPVSGSLLGDRLQSIHKRSSFLTIRLPIDRVGQILVLAGKNLPIGPYSLRVGVPQTMALIPSPRLYSRLVVIKGFMGPVQFLAAVQRQLDSLNVKGKPLLVEQPHVEEANLNRKCGSRSPVLRRTIRIRDKEVVGFALRVEELTADESIIVQEAGIGGRRRFGCGVFIPDRR